jgi:glycosyltransferase involved in cell wall biosynthesis
MIDFPRQVNDSFMKMLLLTTSYSPESTPPQRRWDAFVEAFRDADWDVAVVAPAPHPKRIPAESDPLARRRAWVRVTGAHGETIRRVPLLRHGEGRLGKLASSVLGSVLMVPAALLAPRPDIVVTTVPAIANVVSGYVLSRLWRRPLIVDMRDAWPDLASDARVGPKWVRATMRMVVSGIQRRAELVVTVSEGFRAVLMERGCAHVEMVPNGIARKLDVLPRPNRDDNKLHVLYMGNHGESQGLENLVDAARLAGDYAEVRLAGSGTLRGALMQYAQRTGSPAKFLLPMYGSDSATLYQWADTCVVALRPDWKSFDWTIPSKTYELLGTGRHITGIVRGEAARILQSSGRADIVAADPRAIATLWKDLFEHPERLAGGGRSAVELPDSMNFRLLGRRYVQLATTTATTFRPSGRKRKPASRGE